MDQILYGGTSYNIEDLLRKENGKVPINIIYLNTLPDQFSKDLCVAQITRRLYNWMLINPSNQLQALYYIMDLLIEPLNN